MPKGIYEKSDSPYWWVSYSDAAGKRIRRSTGISRDRGKEGEKEAEALLGKWKSEVHAERVWGKVPEQIEQSHSFDDVMLRYFEDRVSKQRGGFKRAKATAKPLYLEFTGLSMADISETAVKNFIRKRQAQGELPSTINKRLVMFSAACNYVRTELGWNVSNPASGKKLREPEGRVRWLELEEAVSLIQVASSIQRAPWLVDYIQLSLNTGCRAGELLWLEWSRVDLRVNLIYLEEQHTKAGKRRSVPLNDSAREAMLNRARFRAVHCPDSPWVFCRSDGGRLTTLKKSFRTALKRAGIEDFRPHDQRHAAAVFMLREGATLPEIRDVLGHSSVKVTERYAHLHPDRQRETVAKIRSVSLSGHGVVEIASMKRRNLLK